MALAAELSFKVKNKYLNLPISQQEQRHRLTFQAKGVDDLSVVARLSADPEYWVFKDLTAYKGKTLTITYDGPEEALAKVYQADTIRDAQKMYHERNRPLKRLLDWTGKYWKGEYRLNSIGCLQAGWLFMKKNCMKHGTRRSETSRLAGLSL